ncbi:MAG: AAA family ATPase [Humibacillus sp.]|uniref:AAA family ATPase n=1 Tax=Intrasporangium sp. TaxID=1925024 RepID=UPI002648F02E|nr:ATP-binding protein [Intrasporangium sp.]MDN5768256.1 AAA family ATPase [Humibacillus sp.]MDN5778919.1 AAA family ATPase [Humibacillus sp.]MDN5795380.1 AAA family ATPase [Intrasporangium sp.]
MLETDHLAAEHVGDYAPRVEPGEIAGTDDGLEGLLAFRRLDQLLASGVEEARLRYGPEAASDSYRGLYLTEEQVQRSLLRRVAAPLVAGRRVLPLLPAWDRIAADNRRWAWIRDRYELSELELDVVLIALGPDVDRRYEQLYGYLQDDLAARRPTVNLALDLLTTTPSERLAAMRIFAADGPLVGHRIVNLRAERRDEPPLIARLLAVEEQVTAILLGHRGLDHRLGNACRLVVPGSRTGRRGKAEPDGRLDGLASLLISAGGRTPVRLCFHGPPGTGRRRTALALGERLARPVLHVAGHALAPEPAAIPDLLRLALRQAEFDDAVVYLADVDALLQTSGQFGPDVLVTALAAHPGVVVLGTTQPWSPSPREPLGVINVRFSAPNASHRRGVWRREVRAAGATAAAADLAAVADRFRLSSRQIRDAALIAAGEAGLRWTPRGSSAPRLSRRDLFSSARGQTGHQLTTFARRIHPVHGWADLVVPVDAHGQLRELAARVEHRTLVMDEWGFQARLPGGRGVTALFAGPPGTGKTMAASVIAAELGLDLFAIDLSRVVSKYIGETEKNLSQVFGAATDSDAILLFDEADALFGKRSEVRDAHDRYANVEIAYLLQRMEEYDGLAILTTNVRHHIDEAFIRRLDLIVDFPFPDAGERLRIWQSCLPPGLPLSDGVDFAALADHRLAGGNIRNAVLGAAYLAAQAGGPIGRAEFVAATRRELAKMGKILTDNETGPGPDTGPDPPADG